MALRSLLSRYKAISRPSLSSGGSSTYSSVAKKQTSAEDAIIDDQYEQGNLSAESYLSQLQIRLGRGGITPLQVQTLTEKIRNVQVDVTDAKYANAYQKGGIATSDMYNYEKAKLDKMTEPGSEAYIKQQQKVQSLLDKSEKESRANTRRAEMLRISQMPEDSSEKMWAKAQLYDNLEQQARADGDFGTADTLATQKNNYYGSAKRADINDLITGVKLQTSETFGAGIGVPSAEGGAGLYKELTGSSAPGLSSPAVKNALESLDRQKKSLDRLYQNKSDKEQMISTYEKAIGQASGDQKTQLTIAYNNLRSDIVNVDNQIANTTQNITDTVYKVQEINQRAAASGFNQEVRKNNAQFDKAETDLETEFKKGKIDKVEYLSKGIELAQTKAMFYEQASNGFSQFGNEASAGTYMEKASQAVSIHESLVNVGQNIDDYEPVFTDKDSDLTNLFGKKIRKGDVVLKDVRDLKISKMWNENYANIDGVYHRIKYDQLPSEYVDSDGFLLSGLSSDKSMAKFMDTAYVDVIKDGKVNQEKIKFMRDESGTKVITETRANKLLQDGAVIQSQDGGLIWKPEIKENPIMKAAASVQKFYQDYVPGYKFQEKAMQNLPENVGKVGQIIGSSAKNVFERGKEFATTAIEKAKDIFRGMNIFNPPPVYSGKSGETVTSQNINSPYANILASIFGNEAADSVRVLAGENSGHNARARNKNTNGSEDRGLFQINSDTFNDFWARKQNQMRAAGITNYNDMFDPAKNTKMAKIIKDEQGWKAWYGAPDDLRYAERNMTTPTPTPDFNESLRVRNIELALGLPKGTYKKGMRVNQENVDKGFRGNDEYINSLLTGEGYNRTPEPTNTPTPMPTSLPVSQTSSSQQSSGSSWSMPKIEFPKINIPQITQNATSAIKNYFTPTSNNGQNFWSTPVASGLANVQKAVQNVTQPVVNKVQQTVGNVKNWFSNIFKKK